MRFGMMRVRSGLCETDAVGVNWDSLDAGIIITSSWAVIPFTVELIALISGSIVCVLNPDKLIPSQRADVNPRKSLSFFESI